MIYSNLGFKASWLEYAEMGHCSLDQVPDTTVTYTCLYMYLVPPIPPLHLQNSSNIVMYIIANDSCEYTGAGANLVQSRPG